MNQSLVEKVAAKGYKSTKTREKICAFIESIDGMFSVGDIVKGLRGLDKVTVYRTIDLLTLLDFIHPTVHLGEEQLYELHGGEKHHHHVICTSCRKNACVPCDTDSNKKIPGFVQIHHDVAYTSLCRTCVKN